MISSAPAAQLDQLHRDFHAKTVSEPDAVAAVRDLVNVTDAGALDLLTDDRPPSARYAEAVTAR